MDRNSSPVAVDATSASAAHRKIELQDQEDFTYLVNNVRRAAADSINAAFPPVEGAEGEVDELRERIEELVNQYIAQTFTLASPNLTINGLAVDPAPFLAGDLATATTPEEHFEPFDPRKRQRVERLAREEEDLLRDIAALKRRVPRATAAAYADAAKRGVAADQDAVDAAREHVLAAVGRRPALLLPPDGEGAGKAGGIPRREEIEGSFAGAVDALVRLKKDMPATVAKMERARVAGEYVVTQR